MKQVIIIRNDLKMSKGKIVAQACHACLGSYKKAPQDIKRKWENEGSKKVALKCKGIAELKELEEKARKLKLPHYLVIDAGMTELPPGTITALGIGPAPDELIDEISGSLKLL